MALLRLVGNRLKTSFVRACPLVPTRISCFTSGEMYHDQTDTALRSLCSDVLSALLSLPFPSLPSQNVPINFDLAASSKDAAHTRAKLDHDKSKISLASLSPGQAVYLQDSKSSAWDKHGFIVSMRPDRLSYVISFDNRFFTRPRRLLRPVTSDTFSRRIDNSPFFSV